MKKRQEARAKSRVEEAQAKLTQSMAEHSTITKADVPHAKLIGKESGVTAAKAKPKPKSKMIVVTKNPDRPQFYTRMEDVIRKK